MLESAGFVGASILFSLTYLLEQIKPNHPNIKEYSDRASLLLKSTPAPTDSALLTSIDRGEEEIFYTGYVKLVTSVDYYNSE